MAIKKWMLQINLFICIHCFYIASPYTVKLVYLAMDDLEGCINWKFTEAHYTQYSIY